MRRQAPEETEHKSLWISAHARCQGGLQRWAGQSSVHRHRWRCSLTRPDRLRALHLASSCLRCHVCALRQVILLQVEEDHVAEYVNGEPELERVERFEIDLEKRTYRDDSGEGRFQRVRGSSEDSDGGASALHPGGQGHAFEAQAGRGLKELKHGEGLPPAPSRIITYM